jgi:tight adherence protein C
MTTVAILLAMLAAFTMVRALVRPKADLAGARLERIRAGDDPLRDEEATTMGERVILPLARGMISRLGMILPSRMAAHFESQLAASGRPMRTETFIGVLVGSPIIGMLMAMMLITNSTAMDPTLALLSLVVGPGMGIACPLVWLNGRKVRRQLKIAHELPDALDLIVVSVEAGLSLEAAMARVGDDSEGPFGAELRRLLADMNLGLARRSALHGLASRTGVPAVASLVAAIIQADQTGMGIGQVLRAQAAHLRGQRKQHAEEAAMKAPLKMLFPLILFIFPSLFVVILGPAVISFLSGASGT